MNQENKNLKVSEELNLIDDILKSIKKVPSWVYAYNFNHHSPLNLINQMIAGALSIYF
jgi:hypothetical protein